MKTEYHVGVGEANPFYKTLSPELALNMMRLLKALGFKRRFLRLRRALEAERLAKEFSS